MNTQSTRETAHEACPATQPDDGHLPSPVQPMLQHDRKGEIDGAKGTTMREWRTKLTKKENYMEKTVEIILGAAAGHRGVFQSQEREFETNQTVSHTEKSKYRVARMCAV